MSSLFGQQQKEASSDSDSEESAPRTEVAPSTESKMDEDENPF